MEIWKLLLIFSFIVWNVLSDHSAHSSMKPRLSSFGRSKTSKSSRIGSYIGPRTSGLSLNKKHMLLGTAAGLGMAYIGFKLASHNDLYRYTVCEGRRVEINEYGQPIEYKYSVCPPSAPYCCRSHDYYGERCCPAEIHHIPRASMFGSLFGSLLLFAGAGCVIYFCCCRNRRSTQNAPTVVIAPDPQLPPAFPVPQSKPDLEPPPYPAVSTHGDVPYSPQPPIGSAWAENPATPYPLTSQNSAFNPPSLPSSAPPPYPSN